MKSIDEAVDLIFSVTTKQEAAILGMDLANELKVSRAISFIGDEVRKELMQCKDFAEVHRIVLTFFTVGIKVGMERMKE